MARGDMAIIDIHLDGADRAALKRVNAHYELGLSCPWWRLTRSFREEVRVALRAKWERGVVGLGA